MLTRAETRRREAEFRLKLAKYLLGGKCEVCGTTEDLTFNHIIPELKEDGVSELRQKPTRFWREVFKCELMCFKCHMNHHQHENSPYWPNMEEGWRKILMSLIDS